ncbi:MAG: putative integral rane protein [Phycisphaerales bacterium]|nr:putative integral rane protein [Phycisphaerales bacterium]
MRTSISSKTFGENRPNPLGSVECAPGSFRPRTTRMPGMQPDVSGRTSGMPMWAVAGIGAGVMYLLDPVAGARRRSVIRTKFFSTVRRSEHAGSVTARDVANRLRGLAARLRHLFHRESRVADSKLVARVRSAIGRCVSHPSAIEVDAFDGRVILSGPVLKQEVDDLISCVRHVEGVKEVDNHTAAFDTPDDIPALQGGQSRRAQRSRFLRENWTPATRVMGAAVGIGALAAGLSWRGPMGKMTAAFGGGVLLRALTNLPLKRLLGIGAGRRAVDVQKTINIDAPIDVVFDFLSDFESYPMFMHDVKQVRVHGDGKLHVVLAGPAGVSIGIDEQITAFLPNQLIAWRSLPGQLIADAGVARFEPNIDGSTRVDIKMTYNPPAGAAGHALASLFGKDAKTLLDENLLRAKTAIETGRQPHDAAVLQR